MRSDIISKIILVCCFSIFFFTNNSSINITYAYTASDFQAVPPFLTAGVPPLVMLVMGRNHKLYYEAYNDASDLDGDGTVDVGYKPEIDYYGYFDSYKYYQYSGGRFEPVGTTEDKKCPDTGNYWSGDFLNYLTMSRIDCLRKVLYGGYRSTDTDSETVLERAYIPQDSHSWGKEYESIVGDGYDIREYTPLSLPIGPSSHLFANTTLNSSSNPPVLRVLENSAYRIWQWVAKEVYVAGSKVQDGATERTVTDNNVTSEEPVDVTGSSEGTASGSGNNTIESILFDASIWIQYEFISGKRITSYSITTANDVEGRDPKTWTLEASNDESEWLVIDTVEDGNLPSTRRDEKTFTCDNPPSQDYIYYRLVITDQKDLNASCSIDHCMQIAEIKLMEYGNDVTTGGSVTAVTSFGGSPSAEQKEKAFDDSASTKWLHWWNDSEIPETTEAVDYPPENAFDNSNSTKWFTSDQPSILTPVWIQFAFNSPKTIKTYTITTANDEENRDPVSWTLEASNDAITWSIIDTVLNGNLPSNRNQSREFICDVELTEAFTYYRFNITSNKGVSAGVQIAEIEMFEEDEAIPANATLTDYYVRVKVCDASLPESNAKKYPNGNYKPIGILQRNGESEKMYFGLLTGSYEKNMSGGVLRKNVGSIKDEIDQETGQLTDVNGIIKSIDKMRIYGYNYNNHNYGNLISTRSMNEGEVADWGNPVAEMMYETLRYFAGKKQPSSGFCSSSMTKDNSLGLPSIVDSYDSSNPTSTWIDPYDEENDGFDYCAQAFMMILSDINPTYDADQLPGSYFGSFTGDISGLDVSSLGSTIFTQEGLAGSYFIGQQGSNTDYACSEKTVNSFSSIKGLCPEEPTKSGSYYSASVAYYGANQDINSADGTQNVSTYAIGLASPLPDIAIPVGGTTIRLVPFGKKVSTGSGIINGNSSNGGQGGFQPTMSIVDFFVEDITKVSGTFRINFEDAEQGNDHDMDAVVKYQYQVYKSDGTTPAINEEEASEDGAKVKITVTTDYAAMGHKAHMGYIISGTDGQDGIYLVVRDTAHTQDEDKSYKYFLDKPTTPVEGGTGTIQHLAWNHTNREGLPATHTMMFSPGSTTAASLLESPLWYAAKWGGFEDQNNNDMPDLDEEWDKDSDGIPDTYFYVTNPLKLEEQLNKSFADILRRTSSGTAASVISNTKSGEGIIYQSVFYPEYKGDLGNTVTWCGDVHSLFVDSYGNMREDTNENYQLDLIADKIIIFDGDVVYKYEDDDGNSEIGGDQSPDFTGSIGDIKYVWKSSEWLNEILDADITSQREYGSTDSKRYIFTFIDDNQDHIAAPSEIKEFSCESLPALEDLTDTSKIYPYIQVYPQFESSAPEYIEQHRADSDSSFDEFLQQQTMRVINYIRGQDQDVYIGTDFEIPAFRSRQADYDDDGELETWRIGDIVYSTPTYVGKPQENYHLLYKDSSYAAFLDKYSKRRGVVYVGGNDGMFHAFNAGFFDTSTKSLLKTPSGVSKTQFELGAELWAYVPYNLLPHLYWLTEDEYAHVYYCDLKPKIFDARIFNADTDHPSGWGTILVGGMRLGGGKITADMDKDDGPIEQADDRKMTSSYFIFDITNPENPPKLLAEINFPGLGYTTCYPAVIPMIDQHEDENENLVIDTNNWYLVIGSGPAESGDAGINSSLNEFKSDQAAKFCIIDLVKLASNGALYSLNDSGENVEGLKIFTLLDDNAFVSDPVSVDYDLDFQTDALYFGTVMRDIITNRWAGKLRRIQIDDNVNTTTWKGDSVLIDLSTVQSGQVITAAPSLAIDDEANRWVYFGTGRFFVRSDANNNEQQTYYGIKEPMNDEGKMTWATILYTNLLDVSYAKVYGDSSVSGVVGYDNFNDLEIAMGGGVDEDGNEVNEEGWYMDFSVAGERNLGQASLLGSLLTFTSYIPSLDPCTFEGTTNLYALYYKTGTAYNSSVIGEGDEGEIKKSIELGTGLALTPNLHVGYKDGSTAFIQTSTGAIETINQINPGEIKTGMQSWKNLDSD